MCNCATVPAEMELQLYVNQFRQLLTIYGISIKVELTEMDSAQHTIICNEMHLYVEDRKIVDGGLS